MQLESREPSGPLETRWEHHRFDPINHACTYFIHFKFRDGSRIRRAFRYDWRLWTIAETRELLAECGYGSTIVYWELADSDGDPSGIFRPSQTGDLAPAWVAYILAFR